MAEQLIAADAYHVKAKSMNGHHLVLGELIDTITGETVADTHDERYRQQMARLLVNTKGYSKIDIEPRKSLLVMAGTVVTALTATCSAGGTVTGDSLSTSFASGGASTETVQCVASRSI